VIIVQVMDIFNYYLGDRKLVPAVAVQVRKKTKVFENDNKMLYIASSDHFEELFFLFLIDSLLDIQYTKS
jgi:hypothetical protein